jgi:glycerate 2-kinase
MIDKATSIFTAGLKRVDPYDMVKRCCRLKGQTLVLESGDERKEYDLTRFSQVIVLGAGKATAKMALAVEEILEDRISDGIIAIKRGHGEQLKKVRSIEAGHPVPDEGSVKAADEILFRAERGDTSVLFITLISGGGSALLCSPADGLTLEDKQKVTELLLAGGATIGEMNCVRKHLSRIKGGRLAEAMHPATSLNLILSDVIGDRLDIIASGITAGDPMTYEQAQEYLKKYGLLGRIPGKAAEIIERGCSGELPETPKPGDACFARVQNSLIGTNLAAVGACEKAARESGYNTLVLSTQITGEAKEIAKVFYGMARDIRERGLPVSPPACVLAGGETTVTLKNDGKGGRNQEMALSFLAEATAADDVLSGVCFLSGATDGNDGPTDAAGGFACAGSAEAALRQGVDPFEFLNRNDSYHFFDRIGYLLKTGPTNTNVCDIQVLLVEEGS